MDKYFFIGMDVGSTTVKSVVIDAATDQILWQDYQRHDTKQPEKVLEFLNGSRWFRRRPLAHVHHRLRRQRPREVSGRQVRAGS
jgi:ribulose kinase